MGPGKPRTTSKQGYNPELVNGVGMKRELSGLALVSSPFPRQANTSSSQATTVQVAHPERAFAKALERISMSVYGLRITFSGANIRLEIKDEAIWAPTGSQLIVNVLGGNKVASSVLILPEKPMIMIKTEDFKTPTDGSITVSVDTPLDTLTLDVANDGIVSVDSGGDSFVDQTPGERTHTLKLK